MRYGNVRAAVGQSAALGMTPLCDGEVFVEGAKRRSIGGTTQPKRENGSGLENVRENHDK
ncbi:hypothetical protein BRO54_0854 [Geobacillus proteiniphilus]|uniref:Uncharacterized protein n=1 Tax=Geobacillus proteiniphilus TaxID=860353 RepID=A0A1Q5T5B2_9BACL|nr:hypothetical protein BRO54_0854 [Geobacillus proteiniphilus]